MKRSGNHFNWVVILCILLMDVPLFSQDNTTLQQLDQLISEGQYDTANKILNNNLDILIQSESYLEAVDYVYYIGKINASLSDNTFAERQILGFKNRLERLTQDPKILRQLHLEMGSFYETIGNTQSAIENNLTALEYTAKIEDAPGQLFGLIQSNLGVYYSRTGILEKAMFYHSEATKSYLKDATTPKESFYMNYNSLGAMMWYQSKMDSALVYFRKAEKTLGEMEPNPWNKYYRTASLQNNMCGVYSIQGNQSGAIKEMERCVQNLKTYLKQDSIKDIRRQYAREFLFQAMDNYARLYKEIGDYTKAKDIINYAFGLKQKYLNPESLEISKSKVLLGQAHLALHNYDIAEKLLDESIVEFSSNPSPYNHWLGMAYYYKGQANSFIGKPEITADCYQKSNTYFKKSLGDYYDEIYIDFIINASLFYATQNEPDKAMAMANDAYDYIVENQGEKTLLEYLQVLNLAQIEYNLQHFDQAIEKSTLALKILEDSTFIRNNDLGKLRIDVLKPEAIYLKSKAEYQIEPNKTVSFLSSKLEAIQGAISILEEQKTILTDDNTLSILLLNNNEIFEFAKELSLELYLKTNSEDYLNKVLNLHESMLYNRIRNRLNSQANLTFEDLPETIINREKELKDKLSQSLYSEEGFDQFLETNAAWSEFLKVLKEDYPKYYKLRYASISKSTEDLESKVEGNRTIVRYAFIDSKLYAFVISKSGTKFFELNNQNLDEQIALTQPEDVTRDFNFGVLYNLYQSLWEPFANEIKTDKVTIIPDRSLFNLNFEILTPKQISSFEEFASVSLMAKHTIAYNYSLFLLEDSSKTIGFDSNFIAFAPEFSSEMKSDYKLAVTDSLGVDQAYLTLLPQPFTKKLAQVSSRLFDGTSFLNEKASKQIFTQTAREHKIIHIGTHAESNNVSPELSRLIFAKNVQDSIATDDNSLYTFEIYNQNLSSNLAILTACETGKPSYQAGEGMISLAHAFNYAGSESMLTSLWKIDEKSSAEIISLFYDHISKGMDKDLALQQAKLDYLTEANGRTLHPNYWAGLVLIGNPAPIDLQTSTYSMYWVIGIGILVLLFFALNRKQKTQKKRVLSKKELFK